MALRVARSWYPGLNLDRLMAQRAGTDAELEAVADALEVRASDLASFAVWDEYVPERGADGVVIPEDRYTLALDDPEGSAAETDDGESDSDDYAESEPAPDAEAGASSSAAPEAPASEASAPPASGAPATEAGRPEAATT
jgi:hypothetical protein